MDAQTQLELEAAAFRRLREHLMEKRTDVQKHRHDEPDRILPQLSVTLVSRGRQRAWHRYGQRTGAHGLLRHVDG